MREPEGEFGIRPGETAIELPPAFDAGLYFIGRIRTPWTRREECPKNAAESDAVCTIELDPRYAAGLADVETYTHLIVQYWMDRAPRNLVLQTPRHYGEPRGVFALRSPARPNPIAAAGEGPRLPRRHAAPRPQALFRLDRCQAGRRGRVA
jgi:hypothetical protein